MGAPWQIAGYLENRNGRLSLDGHDLVSLAENRGREIGLPDA